MPDWLLWLSYGWLCLLLGCTLGRAWVRRRADAEIARRLSLLRRHG